MGHRRNTAVGRQEVSGTQDQRAEQREHDHANQAGPRKNRGQREPQQNRDQDQQATEEPVDPHPIQGRIGESGSGPANHRGGEERFRDFSGHRHRGQNTHHRDRGVSEREPTQRVLARKPRRATQELQQRPRDRLSHHGANQQRDLTSDRGAPLEQGGGNTPPRSQNEERNTASAHHGAGLPLRGF